MSNEEVKEEVEKVPEEVEEVSKKNVRHGGVCLINI